MTERNQKRLERCFTRGIFLVLSKNKKIPQEEDDPVFELLRQVLRRLLAHAFFLTWLELDEYEEMRFRNGI
jgi:hypothetical protein